MISQQFTRTRINSPLIGGYSCSIMKLQNEPQRHPLGSTELPRYYHRCYRYREKTRETKTFFALFALRKSTVQ